MDEVILLNENINLLCERLQKQDMMPADLDESQKATGPTP
jgi:hypothetical protein